MDPFYVVLVRDELFVFRTAEEQFRFVHVANCVTDDILTFAVDDFSDLGTVMAPFREEYERIDREGTLEGNITTLLPQDGDVVEQTEVLDA